MVVRTVLTGRVRPAKPLKKVEDVLVALDGSAASRLAAAFAARVAGHFHARLHAVLAIDPAAPRLDAGSVARAFELVRRRLAAERAAQGPTRMKRAAALETVRDGQPASAVLTIAREHSVDLVVTGTREAPGKHRFLAGSVAGELIQGAHCPVLVVPELALPPPGKPTLFRAPLAAVDFSPASRAAVESALLLSPGASIDAVHVADLEATESAMLEDLHAQAAVIASARTRLERWLPAHTRPLVLGGRADRALVHLLAGGGYDLVACGTRAAPSDPIGSVAEALLDTAPCPVLVLRGERP